MLRRSHPTRKRLTRISVGSNIGAGDDGT